MFMGVAAAVAAAAVAAGPAGASTARLVGGELVVQGSGPGGGPGSILEVDMGLSGQSVDVRDPVGGVVAGPGCFQVNAFEAHCSVFGDFPAVRVTAGLGPSTVDMDKYPLGATVRGASGPQVIRTNTESFQPTIVDVSGDGPGDVVVCAGRTELTSDAGDVGLPFGSGSCA
jgi:hypothetical protein